MAKPARKESAEVPGGVQPPPSSFDSRFPSIARGIGQEEGWIEVGADPTGRRLAGAVSGGGLAWEGADASPSLDRALRAMEAGIASRLGEHRPERRRHAGASKE